MNSKLWGYVACIVIGVLSGVGGFQLVVAGDVRSLVVKTERMEKELDALQEQTDQRIFRVVDLVTKVLNANEVAMSAHREAMAANRELVTALRDRKDKE